jgi:nitrous oxidase accessory protein NosD
MIPSHRTKKHKRYNRINYIFAFKHLSHVFSNTTDNTELGLKVVYSSTLRVLDVCSAQKTCLNLDICSLYNILINVIYNIRVKKSDTFIMWGNNIILIISNSLIMQVTAGWYQRSWILPWAQKKKVLTNR